MSSSSASSGWVRIRQLADRARHRLSFVPTLYVIGSIFVVQAFLRLDERLTSESLPGWLETTVDSARSVFAAIAGGLITSITLLLSIMLVAVQLASSQFSPRTMRDWLGDRRLQHAVGFVLGTTVFCLLALRSTRDVGENEEPIVPNVTVIVAVTLGVICLVAVVQAVDHITNSLRVESVATRVTRNTIAVVERRGARSRSGPPIVGAASGAVSEGTVTAIPDAASAIEAPHSGWIQQVDEARLLDALPDGSTGYLTAGIGTYVVRCGPVMWIAPAPAPDHPCRSDLTSAFAIGDTRTMQDDVEFGIIQLTDIAVRALSPGINDPSTACEIVVHLGDVLTEVWARELEDTTIRSRTSTLVIARRTHEQLLRRAIDPIVHYGSDDEQVLESLGTTVQSLRAETVRRGLAGPIAPLDRLADEILRLRDAGDRTDRRSP